MRRVGLALFVTLMLFAPVAHAEVGSETWPGTGERTVRLYHNLPNATWVNQLNQAVAAWNTSPYVNIIVAGTRTYAGDCIEGLSFATGDIDLCWNTETRASWLGLASVWGEEPDISYVNIDLNASKSWSTTKMRWVLAHELGHAYGLVHEATCTKSVMVANFSCAQQQAAILPQWRDKQDILILYG